MLTTKSKLFKPHLEEEPSAEQKLFHKYISARSTYFSQKSNLSSEILANVLNDLAECRHAKTHFKFETEKLYLDIIRHHHNTAYFPDKYNLGTNELLKGYEELEASPEFKRQTQVVVKGINNIIISLKNDLEHGEAKIDIEKFAQQTKLSAK